MYRAPLSLRSMSLLAVVVTAACADSPMQAPSSDLSTLKVHLVGGAQLAIGPDGLFAQDAIAGVVGPAEVPLGRSRPLAAAFLKTFGRMFLTFLQEGHGGRIDINAMKPCGRVYLAATPYESLPAETPPWIQRVHGSWWLVTFCGPLQDRQVSVAVSTLATRVQIDAAGRVVYPPDDQSTLFWVLGVPLTLAELPPEPERAVLAASAVSGKRVNAVPRLIAPAVGDFPQFARWETVLEEDASVRVAGGNAARQTNRTYYGVDVSAASLFSYVASDEQPQSTTFRYWAGPKLTEQAQLIARRKADMPIRFDKIALGGR